MHMIDEENNLYGLAYGCPYEGRKDSCPLNEIHHLDFKEKVKWIDDLGKEEKRLILLHHKICCMEYNLSKIGKNQDL